MTEPAIDAKALRLHRSPEETARAYMAFLEEIEPVKATVTRALVAAIAAEPPPPVMLHADGRLEILPREEPPERKQLLAALDEAVRAAARRHGFEVAD